MLCSLVLRDPPRLLPIAAGVAVAELAGARAKLKWPNDVLLAERKVAGILVEGRPQEHWAVLGIGLNVAVRLEELPPELHDRAGTLGQRPDALEPTLERLLRSLDHWLAAEATTVLEAARARDALRGMRLRWQGGEGTGGGIDDDGRLIVQADERLLTLDAGEVHLM